MQFLLSQQGALSPEALQQLLQMVGSSSASAAEAPADGSVRYVNPKQYHRILVRRKARIEYLEKQAARGIEEKKPVRVRYHIHRCVGIIYKGGVEGETWGGWEGGTEKRRDRRGGGWPCCSLRTGETSPAV